MRRRSSGARLVLLLLLALAPAAFAPPAAQAQASDDPIIVRQRELNSLKKEMEDNRKKIEDLKKKEKKLGDLDGRLRRDRELTERYLGQLAAQEQSLLGDLSVRQGELEERSLQHERMAASLRRRLRAYQRHQRPHLGELLFSSKGFSEMFARGALLSRAIQRDRADLIWLRQQREDLEQATTILESRRRGLESLQEEKIREKARIEQRADAAQDEIARVRRERGTFEKRQEELARAEKQIRSLLARLEEERKKPPAKGKQPGPGGPGLAGKANALAWPVKGKLVGRFGTEIHPKFGTRVPSNGIDIEAPEGTPIKSVASGAVEFADWLSGYGRCVIVNHGGGYYTLYAHCSKVLVGKGAKVAEGQTIAEVGDTDSIKGTCLHFEVRKGQEALDPTGFLR